MSSMLRVPGQPLLVFRKVKIVIREREVQRECWGHQLWGLYYQSSKAFLWLQRQMRPC